MPPSEVCFITLKEKKQLRKAKERKKIFTFSNSTAGIFCPSKIPYNGKKKN